MSTTEKKKNLWYDPIIAACRELGISSITTEEQEVAVRALAAKLRAKHKREMCESKDRMVSTAPVRHLWREYHQQFKTALEDWLQTATSRPGRRHTAVKFLKDEDSDVICAITARTVLDGITTARNLQSMAVDVSRNIEDEARCRHYRLHEDEQWRLKYRDFEVAAQRTQSQRRRSKISRDILSEYNEQAGWTPWSDDDRHHVGAMLIGIFRESTGLVDFQNIRKSATGKARKAGLSYVTVKFVVPTDAVMQWLEEAFEAEVDYAPVFLPTTNAPVDWTTPTDGGYPTNTYTRWGIAKTPRRSLRMMGHEQMPGVYDAINYVQRTPWRINQHVLAVADYVWEHSLTDYALPSRELRDLPEKPDNINEDEASLLRWKDQAEEIYRERLEDQRKRLNAARTLQCAQLFADTDIYFPQKLDFRGRMYPVPGFLQFQGADLARGLMEFAEGKPLDTESGRRWLAIHVANSWGEDKRKLHERVAWTHEHEDMIRAISEDPIGSRQWTEADEPWQFLAACFEWDAMRQAQESGEVHLTHLPIGMDGSSQGLQLFSLLMRDPEGAKVTNASPSDVRQDIYTDVAERVTKRLQADVESIDELKRDYASGWLRWFTERHGNDVLPRHWTKRPVMVYPYGGTRQGTFDHCLDLLTKESGAERRSGKLPFKQFKRHCHYLAKVIRDEIEETVQGATTCMLWLQQVANVCTDLGMSISWATPTGFPVHQEYKAHKFRRIKLAVGQDVYKPKQYVQLDRLDKRRQRHGISPNFVHSLDASIMVEAVLACEKRGMTVACIHDCYATHAGDADDLALLLRQTMAELFSTDLLEDFRTQLQGQIDVLSTDTTLPPVPAFGDLDPTCVVNSDYAFS